MSTKFAKDPKTCTHTEWVEGQFSQWGPDDDDWDWEGDWERPTSVDLDIHRYQCTQCGLIRNYC